MKSSLGSKDLLLSLQWYWLEVVFVRGYCSTDSFLYRKEGWSLHFQPCKLTATFSVITVSNNNCNDPRIGSASMDCLPIQDCKPAVSRMYFCSKTYYFVGYIYIPPFLPRSSEWHTQFSPRPHFILTTTWWGGAKLRGCDWTKVTL